MADNNAQDNVGTNDRAEAVGEGLAANDGADTGKNPGTPAEVPAASEGLWRSNYAQQRDQDAS